MNPALLKDWYYVYLLFSEKTHRFYIGCTSDLKSRIEEHNQGNVYSTKKTLPIELVYFEAYNSKKCAYKREKTLKSYGNSLARIKSRIGILKKGRAG